MFKIRIDIYSVFNEYIEEILRFVLNLKIEGLIQIELSLVLPETKM